MPKIIAICITIAASLALCQIPLAAQEEIIISPPCNDCGRIGTVDLRFLSIWTKYLRVGNMADSHDNVLLKVGSGQTTRPDLAVGIGSAFSTAFGIHVAPTFRWIGGGNGPIHGVMIAPVFIADGTQRTSDHVRLAAIQMPDASAVDPNLTIPVLYGLHINYQKPPNVTQAVALRVTGGPVALDGSLELIELRSPSPNYDLTLCINYNGMVYSKYGPC